MISFITRAFDKSSCRADTPALKAFAESKAVQSYPYPALVDIDKAAGLLSANPTEEECEKVLMLSRFSFMGTDGMRGKVRTEPAKGLEALRLFTQENTLSADIVKLSVKAFTKMLTENKLVKEGDCFCTGNDGRDLATNWILSNSMIEGFTESGMNVADLGVTPTPYVPLYMLEHSLTGGAMLTASHNPSNQNGIKFFIDGKKLLSEGQLGDFVLSAYMYEFAVAETSENKAAGSCIKIDNVDRSVQFLEEMLPADFAETLKKADLFVDAANGSWTEAVKKLLQKNNVNFTLTSLTPTGANINANCGVAEIEGHAGYSAAEVPFAPSLAQKIYAAGKECGHSVYGIAVDGDGDRGFVLQYIPEKDYVKVYDGDEESYLIAALRFAGQDCSGMQAVCTIESDIMAGLNMQKDFALKPETVDVGDKWICNFPAEKLALGFESSGHVIIPCTVKIDGKEKVLLSGNGMLTALYTILSLLKGNKAFEPGFSKTYYTYFVNKNLFYPGSSLWSADKEMTEKALAEWKESRANKASVEIKQIIFKDPNVLAYGIIEDNVQTAMLFSRNSGTEDKNAVYLKCKPELKDGLLPIAELLRDAHRKDMPVQGIPETECVNKAMKLLAEKGSFKAADLTNDEMLANSVLHAMVREGRICGKDGVYTKA